MKRLLPLLILALTCARALDAAPLPPLRVSDPHRFLVAADGRPFFWLADTAWQLIHDLDVAELYDALDAPSARQMGYLRKLIEARPFLTHRPDLSVLGFEQERPWEMCLALRGDGYVLVYTPTGRTLDIQLGKLSGGKVNSSWFNPRTGATEAIGGFENQGRRRFDPPGEEQSGHDWVLLLESQ
ncbi:MAG: putative collagen-binding domain-containing protein [Limisphaerales bacterium]